MLLLFATRAQISGKSTGMSEEENLIEELKRSLKITENEYLESEIEDLKEFFIVQTRHEQNCPFDKNCFWLEVFLPLTFRKITKEGKEILENEKPLISFKIKLKNGNCLPIEFIEQAEEKLVEQPSADNVNDTDNITQIETTVITSVTITQDNAIVTASTAENTEEDILNPINSRSCNVDDSLPYEIIEVKISELKEDSTYSGNLLEIFESLIHPNDLSLLNVIEEFYIKLEDQNYPNKAVICRDYYYPVFDCRHWGRSQSSSKSQSSTDNSSSSSSISYRARALYDFQALMQGELSFQENEVLIVLANLGNGWLTARRTSTSSSTSINEITSDDTMTGLIPENYIERL